ncbi:DNA gyrase subunit A [endosymbiont 'TC1' of Trimyema compressum]|uniref:DNA gyrase subunit A n=1 Tax=endosymbiont 'TC1' of Trimyema compressum TaxID=243899 RepID=UPI0007F1427B|nr:DNA gyrase subunit A [endosymbiont 'TC1' of Trimyema compressum]AMP21237.1 DNA gyrase subunit A [endosymbiont 'TC1' of Trimyema compressum]
MESFTHGKIVPITIETEMGKSYIDYAMSVIVGRALPDVRDGLKPVHRRILFAMNDIGMTADKPYKKSARLVGDVLGKYHPHGDSSVYEAMVRLAQDFSTRYLLVDGHGNFGSIDGDSAAAMRYTEARMSKISNELLEDINKDTVDFIPNYDESLEEPAVFPSKIPTLLINGSSGIAVGMATNIPPHNLGEVIDAIEALIDNENITIDELMTHVKGPDFPTGALIVGIQGIGQAYKTGRGSIKMRGKSFIEQNKSGKDRIIVTEIPYQVNKARLIEKIADLVRDKKIEGITGLRDESAREGIRIVIELKRDANAHVILNQLYKQTQLQDTFGVINLALVDGKPRVLNLKQMLFYYLEHQKEVYTRRTKFDLRKAEERAHIVEGLRKAIRDIDEVIRIIKSSSDVKTARQSLMGKIDLSELQANAILEMRLSKLTGLERDKLEEEYKDLLAKIAYYKEILADESLLLSIIKTDLLEVKRKYGDERRSQIFPDEEDFEIEDLIAEEDVVITITHTGYIKRMAASLYRSQKRGGKGVKALTKKTEDFVEHLFVATTHHYLLFFTNKGKVLRLKVHQIPESSRQAKGNAIVNLLNISKDEKITAVIPIREYDADKYLLVATKNGIVKKSSLDAYDSPRKDGLIAVNLDEDDELIGVRLTTGHEDIILGTIKGISIRFPEEEVRPMGRTTRGVKGITLGKDDEIIALDIIKDGATVLVISEHGFGKRTKVEEYRLQGRGGKGSKTIAQSNRNGNLVSLMVVEPGDDIMTISMDGQMIRLPISDISVIGRVTQGVCVMNIPEEDKIVAVARVLIKDDEEEE